MAIFRKSRKKQCRWVFRILHTVATVNDKVLDAGVEMADKVADGTFPVAVKADDVRNKVHTFSDKAKK